MLVLGVIPLRPDTANRWFGLTARVRTIMDNTGGVKRADTRVADRAGHKS